MIELKDVSFSYSGITALKNINLRIENGEAVALMGQNGCGKSTLLKLINGIITPESGSYKFDNDEITPKKLQDDKFAKRFHQRIGFVFQNSDTQLFCLDVYDEIAFGARQMGFDEKEVEKRVNDCLDLLGIQDFKHRPPYHLSGGEKRKVAIACVLIMNPEALVLDEPTNGLDPRSQRWLVNLLTELNRAGKTVIISTHNLILAAQLTKRTLLFDDNHTIVADMPTSELIKDTELLKKVNLVDEYYHD